MPRPRSLRFTIVIMMLVLGSVATTGALALVGTTTVLHRTAVIISDAVDSVRAAEELRTRLLMYARSADPEERFQLRHDMRTLLDRVRLTSGGPHEHRLIDQVGQAIDRYLMIEPGARASIEAALASIDDLVDLNVEQAQVLRRRAERWDRWCNRGGLIAALFLVAGITGVVLWLRGAAFSPILALQATIERIERGDLEARAPLGGPTELRQIADRFNSMAIALATKHRAQLAFLGSVGHEICTPLAALALSVATMERQSAAPGTASQKLLAIMRRQLQRLERLAGDLTDAAQFEAGALALQRSPCDLAQIALDACETFATASPTHLVDCRLLAQPLIISGDRIRLDQVLTNLITNAIKYSPRGGTIRITIQRQADMAVISVSDEGDGIAPEEQSLVFDPFRRAEGVQKDTRGAGLGLFIASQIVRAHGGTITLCSERGRGTTFSVVLSALEVEAAGQQTTASACGATQLSGLGAQGPSTA